MLTRLAELAFGQSSIAKITLSHQPLRCPWRMTFFCPKESHGYSGVMGEEEATYLHSMHNFMNLCLICIGPWPLSEGQQKRSHAKYANVQMHLISRDSRVTSVGYVFCMCVETVQINACEVPLPTTPILKWMDGIWLLHICFSTPTGWANTWRQHPCRYVFFSSEALYFLWEYWLFSCRTDAPHQQSHMQIIVCPADVSSTHARTFQTHTFQFYAVLTQWKEGK